MFGINDILRKIMTKEPISQEEQVKMLHNKRIDKDVVNYLIKRFAHLRINVEGKDKGSLLDLMNDKKLIGWCWQTTESAVVFLNDDDYIERGYIFLDEVLPEYYHSWICFNYQGIEYVLDPSLDFLCTKEDYYKVLKPTIVGMVDAKSVKDELIRQITSPSLVPYPAYEDKCDAYCRALLNDFYAEYAKEHRNEVMVHGQEDVNAPLYRNGSGYQANIEKGRIRKLKVNYYWENR